MSETRNKTRHMVIIALFSAIIVAMTFVPYTGYIDYGVIQITTLHIPVIIGAILLGPRGGFILGTVWGGARILLAFLRPSSPVSVIFLNPLISVLPRMAVGFITGFFAMKLKKVIKNMSIRFAIVAIIGTLTNTVLVLTAISLFGDTSFLPGKTLKNILLIIISVNGTIEIILAIIIIPIICISLIKSGVVKNF